MGNRLVAFLFVLLGIHNIVYCVPAMIKSNDLKMVDSNGRVISNAKSGIKKTEPIKINKEQLTSTSQKDSKASGTISESLKTASSPIPKNAYEIALNKARAKKDEITKKSDFVKLSSNKKKSGKEKTNKEKTKSSKTVTSFLENKSLKNISTDNSEEPKPTAIKVTKNAVVEVRKERGKEPQLKVKLGSVRTSLKISFDGGGFINDNKNRRLRKLKENETFVWSCKQDGKSKKQTSIPYVGKTLIFRGIQSKNGVPANVTVDGKTYRGTLTVSFTKDGATVINNVGMENYLRGVVGREMGSKSPKESLKAQTVIARTYAYRFIDRHKSDEADVCDSTHCQVYAGVAGEAASVDEAIKETKGQIITYCGKPIEALYHATCGGFTSDNVKVFGGVRDYLKRVKCDYCIEGTMYRWNRSALLADLRKTLAKDGIHIDPEITEIKYEAPGYMDRVDNVVFIGKKHTTKVKGTKIRAVLNLPSTTFVVADRKKNIEKITKNSSKEYQNEKKTGIIITEVTKNVARQYMIVTDHGLQRVQMPKDGWDAVVWANVPIVKESKPAEKPLLKSLDLFGRGFGHQVGLCQSGAVGLGKKGWSYREIIGLYYTGVTLYSLGYR